MNATYENPKRNSPKAAHARRKQRASSALRRMQDDLAALAQAKREAGELSNADLDGEIAMLRSVLRRVFALASVTSGEYEEQGGLEKTNPVQLRLFEKDSTEKDKEKEGVDKRSLDVWMEALEALGMGAMRLAALMRTEQNLKGRQEALEKKLSQGLKNATDQIGEDWEKE